MVTVHEDKCSFFIVSRLFLLRTGNVSDKTYRENQNTYFIISNLFPENHVVYETKRKNILEPNRPQATIRRMFIACWMTKARNPHSGYVIPIAFPLQQWLHKRALLLRFSYIAFRVITVCLLLGTHSIFKYRSG